MPPFAQIMACRLLRAKALSEPMLIYYQLDPWEKNISEISMEIPTFSFKKCHLWNAVFLYFVVVTSYFLKGPMWPIYPFTFQLHWSNLKIWLYFYANTKPNIFSFSDTLIYMIQTAQPKLLLWKWPNLFQCWVHSPWITNEIAPICLAFWLNNKRC